MKSSRALSGCAVALLVVAVFFSAFRAEGAEKKAAVVEAGADVTFDYTLADEKGTVLDTSKGKEPMHYIHGQGQIIPGLEKQLAGMAVGDEKKVTVKPEDGYGPVDPRAFQEVPKDKIPPDALKVGAVLTARGPRGERIPVRVHEIKENTVVMDFNHPLAGKTLSFDIKITGIKPPAK
jgi:FKBP-type peptidyl-prolyl cis-trans isomerase SlyD